MAENKIIVNKFIKGVNTDMAEDLLPNSFLSNGHNIKLTNNDNKQGITQKQEGYIKKLDGYDPELKPLAAYVYNDVIYIISHNNTNPANPFVEYGTFPSADLTTLDVVTPDADGKYLAEKVYKYAPLPNFKLVPIITAIPAIFYDVAGIDPEVLHTQLISNVSGDDWVVDSHDPALTLSAMSGPSESFLDITAVSNYSANPVTSVIKVKSSSASTTNPYLTTITIYQRLDPWLKFYPPEINNHSSEMTVDFIPVEVTCSSSWIITSQDSDLYIFDDVTEGNSGDIIGVGITANTGAARTLEFTAETVGPAPQTSEVFQIHQKAYITIPTVSTNVISAITPTTATSGGNATSDGGAAITSKGVCWSVGINPSTSDSITNDGSGTGSFVSAITGLSPGITYYVRAYAINNEGTAYGTQRQFTATAVLGSLTTGVAYNITTTTAGSSGNISDDGGAPITARGVCWSTNPTPQISDNHTNDGIGAGYFNTGSAGITGLTIATAYYLRAYATNSVGTAYGNERSFNTQSPVLATVITYAATDITNTTAKSGGSVNDDGFSSVTSRGVCWSTSPNPNLAGSHTTDGTGTGAFTSSITGLTSGTTYYVRAYATNSVGTAYGAEESFLASSTQGPTVTTRNIINVTSGSAQGGGDVTVDGGSTVSGRGVCWSTAPGPTVSDFTTTDGSGLGIYASNLTSLTPLTTYYVRAYATNASGNGYGAEKSFMTSSAYVPTTGSFTPTTYHLPDSAVASLQIDYTPGTDGTGWHIVKTTGSIEVLMPNAGGGLLESLTGTTSTTFDIYGVGTASEQGSYNLVEYYSGATLATFTFTII